MTGGKKQKKPSYLERIPIENKMKTKNLTTIARDGAKESIWQSEMQLPEDNEIVSGQTFDAIIIGGGLTGVTTALNLCREGKKCLLIEAENLGFGTTGGTSAHLNTFLDTTYPEIDSDFG
jgi:heterodisulfide reductase subunit A-like polyferredoxin